MSDEQENALQAALSTAFTTTDIPLAVPQTPSTGTSPTESFETADEDGQGVTDDAPAAPQDASDEWKAEQERNLERWQHENALQREKAERTRKEWEERRAQGEDVPERDEFLGAHLAKVQNKADAGWEKVESEVGPAQIVQSPSPIDVRDAVPGEGDGHRLQSVLPGAKGPSPSASTSTIQPDSEQVPDRGHNRSPTGSEKWDSFPASMASSYPSLSFPDSASSPRTKSASEPHHGHEDSHDHHEHTHERPRPPASLSVFDSSLSTKTRVIALLGSLTINLVLPFVNGVMLGFGEIFSENVLFKYFGWKKSLGRTSIPGNVGLRR